MCPFVVNYTFSPPRPAATAAAQPRAAANTAAKAQAKTAAKAPLNPSAPLMPPSYDDVLRMDNPAPTAEKVDKPYGLLLIRFPDGHVTEFRDLIWRQQKSLAASEGEIIAFAQQAIHDPDMWPARTSVAILKFPSVEVATDWFNKTPGVADLKLMKTCDAVVAVMSEKFREANRIFSLSSSCMKTSPSKAELAKVFNLYKTTIRKLRIWKTGVNLAATYKFTTLRGKWVEDKYSIGLSQWETMDLLYQFKSEGKVGPNKECHDKLLEILDIKEGIIFQSEDLSLFQKTFIHSNERSDSPAVETHLGNSDSGNDSTQKDADIETEPEAEAEADAEAEPEAEAEAEAEGEHEGEMKKKITASQSSATDIRLQNTDSGIALAQNEAPGRGNNDTREC
ncbi:uncharacterized protein LOC124280225 isoform X3 [Haliotis rubra]|uniref:uncharacterized protein LOC124280225 isoform X3 n=1 Tax=Haliotis rubra TaxID=36100 RepID=UPI001EE61DF7|nr:uncharacterized protein LOC124280225 isoform X3 [Haliotis rubra]